MLYKLYFLWSKTRVRSNVTTKSIGIKKVYTISKNYFFLYQLVVQKYCLTARISAVNCQLSKGSCPDFGKLQYFTTSAKHTLKLEYKNIYLGKINYKCSLNFILHGHLVSSALKKRLKKL